ncbi:MAG: HNH endonuclease [Leptolyngbyaceae cyanobacterium]
MDKREPGRKETLVFLCDGKIPYNKDKEKDIDNRKLLARIKAKISNGEYDEIYWRPGNSTSEIVGVGARAYLFKSVCKTLCKPLCQKQCETRGFIAAGRIIAVPSDSESQGYIARPDLGEAFCEDKNEQDETKKIHVSIRIDSVVNFNSPLQPQTLMEHSDLKNVNFFYGSGGQRFAYWESYYDKFGKRSPQERPKERRQKAIKALAKAWKEHSENRHENGGRRLVDEFLKKAEKAEDANDSELASDYYQQVLDIEPDNDVALAGWKSCHPDIDNEIDEICEQLEPETSKNAKEERRRILAYIARRRGQAQFRKDLRKAYGDKCAISDCDAESALEAAHIRSYANQGKNKITNGILLRADLHTLFDLHQLVICPDTLRVFLRPDLRQTQYQEFHEQRIRLPDEESSHPNAEFLRERAEQCSWFARCNY